MNPLLHRWRRERTGDLSRQFGDLLIVVFWIGSKKKEYKLAFHTEGQPEHIERYSTHIYPTEAEAVRAAMKFAQSWGKG